MLGFHPHYSQVFLWAKLQQISYKYLRKGRQRTCSLYLRHKVTPGIVFGRQCGRLYAGDTRSHGSVSDPASSMSSLRGAVPRSALPWSILNEQTQVCPMIPAAEKGTCSTVTWSKANFSPVIKSQTLFQERFQSWMPCLLSYPIKSEIMGRSIFTLESFSKFLWNAQAQLTPANSLT